MISLTSAARLKQKKLVCLLNKEVSLGKSLNGLAHMSLGMGHMIPICQILGIDIIFCSDNFIYTFRQAAYKFSQENSKVIFSDFTDTMTEGTAIDQLKKTASTPEPELKYFGVSICADSGQLIPLISMLDESNCAKLKNYHEINLDIMKNLHLEEPKMALRKTIDDIKKISIVLNDKLSPCELFNLLILSCLEIGNKSELGLLKLINFVDKDKSFHHNISCHPISILVPKNMKKQLTLANSDSKSMAITKTIANCRHNKPAVVCCFGEKNEVDMIVNRKDFSLWKKELSENDFDTLFKSDIKEITEESRRKDLAASYKKLVFE